MNPVIWVTAFLAMTALDIVWVFYTQAAVKNWPLRATLWAGAIHGFSGIAVITYTDDPRYMSATMLGALLGTFSVVWWHRRKEQQNEQG